MARLLCAKLSPGLLVLDSLAGMTGVGDVVPFIFPFQYFLLLLEDDSFTIVY